MCSGEAVNFKSYRYSRGFSHTMRAARIAANEPQTQMSTALAATPKRRSALEVMATKYEVDAPKLLDTLKATVFKGATNEQLLALVVVANQYGLNPFTREIYAFPAKGGGIVPVVGVDGWIGMMNRQPNFDGVSFKFSGEGDNIECEATVHLKDRSKPVVVTEYMSECFRETEPWKTYPKRMLRHKALIQAARVAFGFSGIYDEEEARVAAAIDITPPSGGQSDIAALLPPSREEAPPQPQQQAAAEPPPMEPWEKLGITVEENGYTFAQFKDWAVKGSVVPGVVDAQSWKDVQAADANRLLRSTKGMLQQLALANGGGK